MRLFEINSVENHDEFIYASNGLFGSAPKTTRFIKSMGVCEWVLLVLLDALGLVLKFSMGSDLADSFSTDFTAE